MPSKSKAQHNLMAMVAHDPKAAKRVGISQSVGKEFMSADKGKKFAGGGEMKKMFGGKETRAEEMKEAKALKSGKISPKQYVAGEKSEGHGAGAAKKAAAIKSGKLSPAAYAKEDGMKKGGKVKKYEDGGDVSDSGFDWSSLKITPRGETLKEVGARMPARQMDQGKRQMNVRQTGKNWTDMRLSGGKSALPEDQKGMGGMKKGGKVIDGIAQRGKTKGTMVKMCGGGMAKKGK